MLWNKAKNIILLKKNKFKIPETIIIKNEKKKLREFLENIKWNKKYILRPSFNWEDSENKSYAGYYNSIFPLKIEDIYLFFSNNNYYKKFWWKNKQLKSIIIQEFIEDAQYYWVYFTRNPNNIFENWFYEISKNNQWVTSWKDILDEKLSFIEEKELYMLWKKLENIFKSPQDIEFCIKNKKIIIFQTRNITTWNLSHYNLEEIKKISGIFQKIDFDELWENNDFFSYNILDNLFNIILINWNIYFRKTLLPKFLLKNYKNIKNINLRYFLLNYKKYLLQKFSFNIIKYILFFQRLDKNILNKFFRNYNYSFLRDKNSYLNLEFIFKTNFITNLFLKIEKTKNISFSFLEKYKKEYNKNNEIIKDYNINLDKKLYFLKWIIIKSKKTNEKNIYIYKWKIHWVLTDLDNFNISKKNQVLFIDNLDFYIFDKIKNISGIIIKNWNMFSHNSIILREHKIPSIIKYSEFEKLKIWEVIEII